MCMCRLSGDRREWRGAFGTERGFSYNVRGKIIGLCCNRVLTRLGEAGFGSRLWSVVLDGVFGAFAASLDLVAKHVDLLAYDLPEKVGFPGLGTVHIACVILA